VWPKKRGTKTRSSITVESAHVARVTKGTTKLRDPTKAGLCGEDPGSIKALLGGRRRGKWAMEYSLDKEKTKAGAFALRVKELFCQGAFSR